MYVCAYVRVCMRVRMSMWMQGLCRRCSEVLDKDVSECLPVVCAYAHVHIHRVCCQYGVAVMRGSLKI